MTQVPAAHRQSGIEPYAGVLDERRAAHLLRRSGFGVDAAGVDLLIGRPASDAVRAIVAEAVARPEPSRPLWTDQAPPPRGSTQEQITAYNRSNGEWTAELRGSWLARLHEGGLRERMTLFWHGHFVTELPVYAYAVFAERYLRILTSQGMGNFRTLVSAIGLTPAMLRYLDGNSNRAGAPNENYARELLELFTMSPISPDGLPNYTEADIQEIARALTGWQIDTQALASVFNPARFDGGSKSFFGRTGPFGYEDVVAVVFEERSRQIADFIARKLYAGFVFAEPDPGFCADLAEVLLQDGFELAPCVERLLASERFFDPAFEGARVKSPVEFVLGTIRALGVVPTDDGFRSLERSCRGLSQTLLDPPSVAGWPGHHDWLNASLLPLRWSFTDTLLSGSAARLPDLVPLASALHDPDDPESAFHLPQRLATHLLSVPPEALDLPPIDDPFAGDLARHPVPDWVEQGPAEVRTLAKMFLAGLPWYEWSVHAVGANTRLAGFVRELAKIPEYQLA